MRIEFHAAIFDEDQARRERKWGEVGFSFTGMTESQRTLLITVLRRTAAKLEEHAPNEEKEMAMSLRKTGSGKILNEEDEDLTKTGPERLASYEALAQEMTEEERRAARNAQ